MGNILKDVPNIIVSKNDSTSVPDISAPIVPDISAPIINESVEKNEIPTDNSNVNIEQSKNPNDNIPNSNEISNNPALDIMIEDNKENTTTINNITSPSRPVVAGNMIHNISLSLNNPAMNENLNLNMIFDIAAVGKSGDEDFSNKLINNDMPLNLRDKQYIALSWTESNYETYCIVNNLNNFDVHESLKEVLPEQKITLDDCFNLFTNEEQLGVKDTWFCSTCNDHMQAFKKFDIWNLPPILVIHLKRFSFGRGPYDYRDKLDDIVDFPLELNLTGKIKCTNDNILYDLYAVSNHHGNLGAGHYTAYCKHRDGNWHEYDDSRISPMNESSVVTEAAYVLFYKKKEYIFQPFQEEWDHKSESVSKEESGEASIDQTIVNDNK